MDGSGVEILALNQRPCVVHYLERYNKFLVGTYELYPSLESARLKLPNSFIGLNEDQLKQRLEAINHRAGKLILLTDVDINKPKIEFEFDCEIGGGVFDVKVTYDDIGNYYKIYVAHSNGVIGLYKLSLNCGNKICLKDFTVIMNSKMLTSIDIFTNYGKTELSSPKQLMYHSTNDSSGEQSSSNASIDHKPSFSGQVTNKNTFTLHHTKLVVGDSTGFITVINHGIQVRADVAKGDSIWQVKALRLPSDSDIILVGAENSSWYIYGLNHISELVLLYKNEFKDFNAGVTSICTLNIMNCLEYDMIEILLGSYDESLQMYHVKVHHEANSTPDVCHKHTMSINQGGIWRVKQITNHNYNNKSKSYRLCIAAMYAGSYITSLNSFLTNDLCNQTNRDRTEDKFTRLVDVDSLNLSEKSLHYDIDVTSSGTTFCIADFNNSLCLVKTIDKLP